MLISGAKPFVLISQLEVVLSVRKHTQEYTRVMAEKHYKLIIGISINVKLKQRKSSSDVCLLLRNMTISISFILLF